MKTTLTLLLLLTCGLLMAQDEVSVVSSIAEGLDLQAVSELFKESENLEAFEKALNDPDAGVNNLDLNEDGQVDYIRVMEEAADDVHLVVLQAALGEDEFQDVATIEIEKSDDDDYNLQVHGNEDLYGPDYYVAPTVVTIGAWPVIRYIYRPGYRPYSSVYHWGHYPRRWRKRAPVKVHVYHQRVAPYRKKNVFHVTRTSRVRRTHVVKYKPHRSPRVVKKTTVVKTPRGKTVVKKTTRQKRRR